MKFNECLSYTKGSTKQAEYLHYCCYKAVQGWEFIHDKNVWSSFIKRFCHFSPKLQQLFFSNLINKSLILMYHLNVGDLCIPKITSTTSKVLIGVINSGPLLSYALNDEIFTILFCSSISAGIDRSRTVT